MSHTSDTHVGGESDGRVLPTKRPNDGGDPLAEGAEGRRPTKENIEQTTALRTQSRNHASSGLLGVREVAWKDKRTRFTALLHHLTVALLRDSCYALKLVRPAWMPSRGRITRRTSRHTCGWRTSSGGWV